MLKKILNKIKNIISQHTNEFFCIDLDPLFNNNNLSYNFNYFKTDGKDINNYIFYKFDKKTIKFYIKNFNKMDIFKLPEYFNDYSVFVMNDKIFNNKICQTILSFILNNNSYVLVNNKCDICCKKLLPIFKKFKKKKLLFSNKNYFYNKLIFYFSNKIWRKNNNIEFINWYETLHFLKNNDNLLRIGDGDIGLMFQEDDHPYQKYNKKVSDYLKETFNYFINKNLIAINDKIASNYKYLNDRHNYQDLYIQSKLEKNKKYYSACLFGIEPYIFYKKEKEYLFNPTSFYINNKNYPINSKEFYAETNIGKEALNVYLNEINTFFDKKLYKKDIILVTGRKNSSYLKSRIFKNAKSINIFYIDDFDAFNNVDEYVEKLKKIILENKNYYFILSSGPVGKYLAMIIDSMGSKFIDIGNLINYYNFYSGSLKIDNIQTIHSRKKFEKYK